MVAVLVATCMQTACSKKPAPVKPAPSAAARPAQPNPNAAKTVIEGTWQTDCIPNANGFIQRVIMVQGNLLSFTEYSYTIDDSTCFGDGVGSSDPSANFYRVYTISSINDSTMTHQVDFIKPSGEVEFSWLLQMRDATRFMRANISFLNSRDSSDFIDNFTKK